MTASEQRTINTLIQEEIDRQRRKGAGSYDSSLIAFTVFKTLIPDNDDPIIEFSMVRDFTAQSRKILAKTDIHKKNVKVITDEKQGHLFIDELQETYPVPGKTGIYKERWALTNEEFKWNIEQLRKTASGFFAHADALEEERKRRFG